MELSQSALAMLAFCGIPLGITLNIVFSLTDIARLENSIIGKLALQIKEFLFALTAGLMAIILVYYCNNGDFRYLAVIGMLVGYILSNVLFSRRIIRIRDCIGHFIFRIISIPLQWIWGNTFAIPIYNICNFMQIKHTNLRMQVLERIAETGFEN